MRFLLDLVRLLMKSFMGGFLALTHLLNPATLSTSKPKKWEGKMSQGDPELEQLARLLYGENREELSPDEAAQIVRTVYERKKLQGYPGDVLGVLAQPRQYSPFSPGPGRAAAANAAKVAAFGPDHPEWEKYITLAQYGYQQAQQPQAEAPTHYFSGPKPGWARNLKLTTIGKHSFGRENRKAKKTQ